MKKEEPPIRERKNQQQPVHNKRNLDDLFNNDSTKEKEPTPEEEAQAEQQRKEALTERD